MATDTSLDFWCLVDGDDQPFTVTIPAVKSILNLKKHIHKDDRIQKDLMLGGTSYIGLTLWKLQVQEPIIPARTLASRIRDRGDLSGFAFELNEDGAKVLDMFPVHPPPTDHLNIIVQFASVQPRRENSEGDRLPDLQRQRATSVEHGKNAPPPSSGARLPMLKAEQEKRPVMNGRPMGNSGLPVQLFHPAFSTFQSTLTDPGLVLTAEDYRTAHEYMIMSSEIYHTERQRRDAVFASLISAIHSDLLIVTDMDGTSPDGSVMVPTDGGLSATTGICEMKNEIGTGGSDPSVQGVLSYRKIWVTDKLSSIRESCCCPSFILAVAGPWMCVLGAVFTETVLVQQLTDFIWTGGNPYHDKGLESVTRLFNALRIGLQTLQTFYSTVSASPIAQPLFPFINSYSDSHGTQVKFRYVKRLCKTKAVYFAEDDTGRKLIVKFVERYNSQAHSLLARHGLAPDLYYSALDPAKGGRYGGLDIVGMSFVQGRNAYELFPSGRLPGPIFLLVKQAIDMLHAQSIVFGDLRLPNIIITDDGKPMLIDFDWCGTHMIDRYPPSLNDSPSISWHSGVSRNGVMSIEHDNFMLSEMQPDNIMDVSR